MEVWEVLGAGGGREGRGEGRTDCEVGGFDDVAFFANVLGLGEGGEEEGDEREEGELHVEKTWWMRM